MSEMLANQYFISGRYFEAFEEYSELPKEKRNNLIIRKKMIISAALEGKFEIALSLLSELALDNMESFNGIELSEKDCPCSELTLQLEDISENNVKRSNTIKLQIAILNYFSDREKSLKYFRLLKNSKYADSINQFFKSITKTTQKIKE